MLYKDSVYKMLEPDFLNLFPIDLEHVKNQKENPGLMRPYNNLAVYISSMQGWFTPEF